MEALGQDLLEIGVATLALPGQAECGDRFTVQGYGSGVLVAVVDGLGHGDEAAAAAQAAIKALEKDPQDSIISIMNRCHDALRSTRGAVLSLAQFNPRDETMTWLGVGNVEGTLLRADPAAATPPFEPLLLRRGVVGHNLPRILAAIVQVSPGDLLILATDGIQNGFPLEFPVAYPPQKVADRILARHAKKTDDALILVAKYKGWAP